MTQLAFLTLEDRSGYVIDDAIALPAFAARGLRVVEVPWTRFDPHAASYAAVIVRTTWDYQRHLDRFLTVLKAIEDAGIPLANSLALIRWNATKTYLQDLERRGIPIVPTLWGTGLDLETLRAFPSRLGSEEFVVKPIVGANADDTFRLSQDSPPAALAAAAQCFAAKSWMVQPFVRAVVDEGEYSLFYFGGELSHVVVKKPKRGDFRVQEEHGGLIVGAPPTPELSAAAGRVMDALGMPCLQARVDLVRLADGSLVLMELEAIEPSLYFRTSPAAGPNFAAATEQWLVTTRADRSRRR